MEILLTHWMVFVLAMGRVWAVVALAPVLGGRLAPAPVKIGLILALTLACYGGPWPLAPMSLPLLAFFGLLIKEVLAGLLMVFTLLLVLAACQSAGELAGFQMTFTAGEMFMPATQEQNTIMGGFFYLFSILMFLAVDGQHALVWALRRSFETMPVLQGPGSWGPVSAWMTLMGRMFESALQLALPVVVSLFATNLAMGMIARTMPQLNIFIIGMPVQIAVGLGVLIMMLAGIGQAEQAWFQRWIADLGGWIRAMGR